MPTPTASPQSTPSLFGQVASRLCHPRTLQRADPKFFSLYWIHQVWELQVRSIGAPACEPSLPPALKWTDLACTWHKHKPTRIRSGGVPKWVTETVKLLSSRYFKENGIHHHINYISGLYRTLKKQNNNTVLCTTVPLTFQTQETRSPEFQKSGQNTHAG